MNSEDEIFEDILKLNKISFHKLLLYGLCHEELHLVFLKIGIDDMLIHSHIILHNLYWLFDINYPYPWPCPKSLPSRTGEKT